MMLAPWKKSCDKSRQNIKNKRYQAPKLWPPDAKTWPTGKYPDAGKD